MGDITRHPAPKHLATAPARAASVSREHAGEDTPRWVVRAPDGSYIGEAAKVENAKDLARRWAKEQQDQGLIK